MHALLPLSLSFRAGVIPHIPEGKSLNLTFTKHVEGRYVTVLLPGSDKVLTLCEVEVYGYRTPTGEDRKPKSRARHGRGSHGINEDACASCYV